MSHPTIFTHKTMKTSNLFFLVQSLLLFERFPTVYSVQCTVYSVQCTVFGAECRDWNPQPGDPQLAAIALIYCTLD